MNFEMGRKDSKGRNVYWTDNPAKHKKDGDEPNSVWWYMKTVAVHEFGHTLGLTHIPHLPSSMGDPHVVAGFSVTENDRKHLRALYYDHDRHF